MTGRTKPHETLFDSAGQILRLQEYASVAARRRAESVALIATGLAVAAVPSLFLVWLFLPDPAVNVPLVASGFVFYALIVLLLRHHRVSIAAWLLVAYFAVAPILGSLLLGQVQASPLFLMLTMVVAACLLPPRQVVVVAVIAFAELAVMASVAETSTIAVSSLLTYVAVAMAVLTATAVVLAVAIERALSSADASRRDAQRLANDLQEANLELEERVVSRTAELQQALHREQLLSAELSELSIRDPLTGLHNRRYLDEEMPRLFAAAQRRGEPLGVAAIDLDKFKSINDDHTHRIGDEVLRITAQIMSEQTRTAEVLVRTGGEEFVLLMPGASSAESAAACERMRERIQAHDWDNLSPGLAVTASFGVATSDGRLSSGDMLQAADHLLYRAKREGRNRVIAAESGVA